MATNPATSPNAFAWKQNLACVSCFKTLAVLGQFNEAKLNFEKAGTKKLSDLNYFLQSSDSPNLLEMSALLLTQQYVKYLSVNYVLAAQKAGIKWTDVQLAMLPVLKDKTKTLSALAEVIDGLLKFADE